MTQPQTWRPLFDGEAAEEVWQAIDRVVKDLRDPKHGIEALWEAEPGRFHGLADGAAGIALLFTYLHLARPNEADAELAAKCLDRAIDALASEPMPPALYGGFTGIGWAAQHLEALLYEEEEGEEDEDSYAELDETLAKMLEAATWQGDYDLISGLAGFAVYALERLPAPGGKKCLKLLLDQIEELAEEKDGGRTWFTPPDRLPPHQREVAPDGYYNLGVAHGMPAISAILSEILAAGIETERARSLLADSVRWLMGQELPADIESRFSSWQIVGGKDGSCRLAWCYGDAGVMAALMLAGRRAGREDWQGEAMRIAQFSAERAPETAGIRDAGLCHGSAGLGHIFNRMYQATGDERLAEAARYWFKETLKLYQADKMYGGFPAWGPDRASLDLETLDWQEEPGFLTGGAGVAMALLGAVSTVEPNWDRVLLTSVPMS